MSMTAEVIGAMWLYGQEYSQGRLSAVDFYASLLPDRKHTVGEMVAQIGRAHAHAALEAAMAALCPGCRHSVETWEQKDWLPDGPFRQFRGWMHKYGNGIMSPCEAAAIRALREEGSP